MCSIDIFLQSLTIFVLIIDNRLNGGQGKIMDQNVFNRKIGENLQRLRNIPRLTQDGLASSIGVSRATIANMETGRQAMSAYQLVRIANALNLPSVDDLLDLRPGESDDGDSVLFRPPEIAERARTQITSFVSRHSA